MNRVLKVLVYLILLFAWFLIGFKAGQESQRSIDEKALQTIDSLEVHRESAPQSHTQDGRIWS